MTIIHFPTRQERDALRYRRAVGDGVVYLPLHRMTMVADTESLRRDCDVTSPPPESGCDEISGTISRRRKLWTIAAFIMLPWVVLIACFLILASGRL